MFHLSILLKHVKHNKEFGCSSNFLIGWGFKVPDKFSPNPSPDWCSVQRFSWDPIRRSESLGWKIFPENSGVWMDGGGTFIGFLRGAVQGGGVVTGEA